MNILNLTPATPDVCKQTEQLFCSTRTELLFIASMSASAAAAAIGRATVTDTNTSIKNNDSVLHMGFVQNLSAHNNIFYHLSIQL